MTGGRRVRWSTAHEDHERLDSCEESLPITAFDPSRQPNAELHTSGESCTLGGEANNINIATNEANNISPHLHFRSQVQQQQQQQQPWPFNFPRQPDDFDDEYSEDDDNSNNELDDEDEVVFNHLNYNQSLAAPEIKHERLEWQQMLQSVLMGEVLKSEKKRLSTSDRLKQQKPIQEIWLSLRALLRGRTIAQEQKYLEEGRREIPSIIDRVMAFRVVDSTSSDNNEEEKEATALDQVAEVLKSVDRIESLYTTRAEMILANPKYGAPEFQARLDALNAWCTITRSLCMQYKILSDWTGSSDLQVARKQDQTDESDDRQTQSSVSSPMRQQEQQPRTDPSFVERILKESALQDTFDKRTLSALNLLLVKSKRTMIANNDLFKEMNLPPFLNQLRQLAVFPTSLVEEALKLRLEYKDRLHAPPKPMVDAMMEDYRGLLALACRVKKQYEELAYPAPGWQLKTGDFVDHDYDNVLMESMRFYFRLITWKLDLERENSLRECEVMEKEWEFFKSTVCQVVDKADEECAGQFCQLTNRLLGDVMKDYISSLKIQPESVDAGIEAKYTKLLHNMRMRARKLLQFFTGQFENAAEYVVDANNLEKLVDCLVDSGHFLVLTGSFEEERTYVIASPSLYGRIDDIRGLIRACFAGDRYSPSMPSTPGSAIGQDDYLVILTPWQNIMWTGEVVEAPTPFINLGIKTKRARLVTGDASVLQAVKAVFWSAVQSSGIEILQEHRAHIPRINKELSKVKMTVFKLADSAIASVSTIREQTIGLGCQELVEECFSFSSDFGMRAAKFLELAVRLQLDLKLVRLAIDWISFITDECIPSDHKTFRWAVAALEFGYIMTHGVNILALNESEFIKLQSKVARCIALLISHFDVLGTRWTHELQAKEAQQLHRGVTAKRNLYMTGNKRSTRSKEDTAMSSSFDSSLSASGGVTYIRDVWMRKIQELEAKRNKDEQEHKIVGKILDDQKPEDQSLVFLAPSSSNISFRWQQGRFIGAGTFGSVYLAINLDTSNMMAVKEIRFPDSSALSALHKSIKEEMKVMEMLHHDNIVQYFGMEVHRDKVYIFMEYCENGSLGSLLDHGGRIEDEVYIMKYAYELLSGLEYLHGNNIVHRDIKPDNILIDFQGRLKLSDFGAAKILAKGQKTMGRTTMNMNVNSLAGTPMYMAPEVITGGDTGRKGSMDIWSLGCCIVQMATGRRPWSTLENEWSVMYHVVTGHPPLPDPTQLSSGGIDFLKKCFTRNPMRRPTAHELLSHPWIMRYLDLLNNPEGQPEAFMATDEYGDRVPIPSIGKAESFVPDEGALGRSIGSTRSYDRPLVRSIANSMAIEGMVGSHMYGDQAQAYFRDIAAQHAQDLDDVFQQDAQTTKAMATEGADSSSTPGPDAVPADNIVDASTGQSYDDDVYAYGDRSVGGSVRSVGSDFIVQEDDGAVRSD
ncbi:hypothetical protein BX666DRAFT_2025516 [Dichotomocladium elegans]|nr:hypothetical protein BX666DRAFT_2025516 [Dichotomocladium elegans]